jgi:hypothetical protein
MLTHVVTRHYHYGHAYPAAVAAIRAAITLDRYRLLMTIWLLRDVLDVAFEAKEIARAGCQRVASV